MSRRLSTAFMPQLYACICRCKLPIDGFFLGVATPSPGVGFLPERFQAGDPPVQTLPGQDSEDHTVVHTPPTHPPYARQNRRCALEGSPRIFADAVSVRFFERPTDRFIGNGINHLQSHQSIGQHPQGPTSTACGRRTARQRDQPGFLSTIKQQLYRRGGSFLPSQRRFQTVLHKALAHISHGVAVAVEQPGNLQILFIRASSINL